MVINVKKHILKNIKHTTGTIETREEDRTHYENAYKVALSTNNLQLVNIKTFLKELTNDQLDNILKIFPCETKNVEDHIKRLTKYMKEVNTLNIVKNKIEHAKDTLLNCFIESFISQYTKISGNRYKWNLDKFKYDVESQLEKLNHATSNMNDA